jgi:hypothetical protein
MKERTVTDDQTAIPTDEEQELFPKTQRELANEFLEHFQADVEAAEKSVYNARVKLRSAIILRDDAEENLRRAIAQEHGVVNSTAEEEPEPGYAIDAPAEEIEDAEIVEYEPDPEPSDEVESVEEEPVFIADDERAVWVTWPEAEEAIRLMVGEKTRFGELVANYLNANPEVDFLARYVISDAEGTTYDPKSEIPITAYGMEFFIEPELAVKKEA